MFRGSIVAAALLAALAPALGAQQDRAARAAEERAAAAAERGWIGVQFIWVDDRTDEARVRVLPRSAAAAAGLRDDDVVVRIDGRAANSEAVDALRESLKPGGVVVLAVRDGDGTRDVRVTATARPRGEAIAERVIRLRRSGDGETVDTIIRGGEGENIVVLGPMHEALRAFERDTGKGRYVFRFQMDSLAVRMDSLRFHADSLRAQLWRMEPGHGPGFEIELDRDGPMEFGDRAVYEEVVRGMGDGPLPFFMEMGRRSLGGAELAEMNEGLGRYFRVNEGLLVLAVSPETPAARAGLEAGDVIVEVEGSEVHDVVEFRRAVARAEDGNVTLQVMRQGRRRELTMEWDRVRPVRIRTAPRGSDRTN